MAKVLNGFLVCCHDSTCRYPEISHSTSHSIQQRHYWWASRNDSDGKAADLETHAEQSDAGEFSPLVHYRRAQQRTSNVPRRIYILGVGNIGGFVAHSLAGIPNRPPMTFLLPSRLSLDRWVDQGQALKLTTHGLLDTKSNFEVEHVRSRSVMGEMAVPERGIITSLSDSPAPSGEELIHNLIVSVKAFNTVNALQRIAHRLTRESAILFIQNGMGIIEEVNEKVFPEPGKRPQYMLGVISHGIYQTNPFSFVHSGHGTTALTILPRRVEEVKPHFESSALYLLRTMTRTPVLAAVGFGPTDLMQLQIEKLAVNAIINPLTALMSCQNGELLHRPSISRIIRLLLAEISLVIKSLPELQGVPNVRMRFDIARLENQVLNIAYKTAANRSSMLQDFAQGRATEIEYITGYFVRRGEEIGIQCVLNYMLKHMVKAKERLEGERHASLLPLKPQIPSR